MLIGYAQTAPTESHAELQGQIDQLERQSCDLIFHDECVSNTIFGGTPPQLVQALSHTKHGDEFCVVSSDRLGQTEYVVRNTVRALGEVGATLTIIRNELDVSTYEGRFKAAMMASIARLIIEHKRSMRGFVGHMAIDDALGVVGGESPTLPPSDAPAPPEKKTRGPHARKGQKQITKAEKRKGLQLLRDGMSLEEISPKVNASITTLYAWMQDNPSAKAGYKSGKALRASLKKQK